MPLLKKRQKRNPEIPTASMADIAFLLLIFFMLTTSFLQTQSLSVVTPAPSAANNSFGPQPNVIWIRPNE